MFVCYLDTRDLYGNKTPQNRLSTYEICISMAEIIHPQFIEGAQEIQKGIWHLYTKDQASRLTLVTSGINCRGRHVSLHEEIPSQNQTSNLSEKIFIRSLPLDIDNKYIEEYLTQNGVDMRSDVKYSYARKGDGSFSTFKTGERFVYAKHPVFPVLPQRTKLEGHPVTFFHQSQRDSCKSCLDLGHKSGDACCPAAVDEEKVEPFRSYQNKLSNMSPCDIQYKGQTFKSVGQAYQWAHASERGRLDIGTRIRNAPHAGAAKSIYKQYFTDDEREQWRESQGLTIMAKLVHIKFATNKAHRDVLLSTGEKTLGEATYDTFWGCGLTPHLVSATHPNFWPGKNWLGTILMRERAELRTEDALLKSVGEVLQAKLSDNTQSAPSSPARIEKPLTDDQWETDNEENNPKPVRKINKRRKTAAKKNQQTQNLKELFLKNMSSAKRGLASPDEPTNKRHSSLTGLNEIT